MRCRLYQIADTELHVNAFYAPRDRRLVGRRGAASAPDRTIIAIIKSWQHFSSFEIMTPFALIHLAQ
jgi:hypothetical protein